MNEIGRINSPQPALAGIAARRAAEQQQQHQPRGGGDQVELSTQSQLMARLKDVPEVRQDLVDQARQRVESGFYDSQQVIEQTIDKMAEDL
jgi:anti-sigma28 factor (negative regulator of flagellin synthesis)